MPPIRPAIEVAVIMRRERTTGPSSHWQLANLDTRIALRAADLHRQYRLATADAVVYATAQEMGADLLTCDAHFDGLPGVVYVAKIGK